MHRSSCLFVCVPPLISGVLCCLHLCRCEYEFYPECVNVGLVMYVLTRLIEFSLSQDQTARGGLIHLEAHTQTDRQTERGKQRGRVSVREELMHRIALRILVCVCVDLYSRLIRFSSLHHSNHSRIEPELK